MLEILLQYGANVKTSDTRGQPPLHRCILKGKASAARLPLTSLSKFISTYVLRACTMGCICLMVEYQNQLQWHLEIC
ncbi:ADP-ribosylation factor GTPase-activating protein AGD3-like isoform X2 [Beta vulgaris subsp. vulgaris]|uniref:ADP-ribosylation factor GTPase-activating protein AGD3-like isoform X2 n=1 Tax=Beta vulgaris subsp. vulgaris TaxID=3555 RepID=UPI0025466577|nr:ADP-ribosylation factor GTPase-activating protein AGD3-like isoform X2 [Beta vulgaris subsp. vulgaris]